MGTAETVSRDITRLVLGVNFRVGLDHGSHLETMAADIGLTSLELLPHFADFLLDGLLTREIALLRMRYLPEDQVLGRLDELERKGLIELNPWGYVATNTLRPLLKALHTARADVAAQLWVNSEVQVSIVTETAKAILDRIGPDHLLAHTHNRVRKPLNRYSLLYQRLVTMRYLRQQDHAEAWQARDLDAREIVLMTAMWREEPVAIDEPPLFTLREAGYVLKADPPRLSAKGKKLRQAIENDTDVRTQRYLDEMEPETLERFVSAVSRIPD